MYQNAGEKGHKHKDPDDPPRRRANEVKGHGTWDNDRPPIVGVVGRELRYDTSLILRADIDFCLQSLLRDRIIMLDI